MKNNFAAIKIVKEEVKAYLKSCELVSATVGCSRDEKGLVLYVDSFETIAADVVQCIIGIANGFRVNIYDGEKCFQKRISRSTEASDMQSLS
jgi:hypothetical protein